MAVAPPAEWPKTTARADPAASRTARASATFCSTVNGVPGEAPSDNPTPRRSNRMNRAKAAKRASNRLQCGSSAIESTEIPGPAMTRNRSKGPSPSTWYAMYPSVDFAYWTGGSSPMTTQAECGPLARPGQGKGGSSRPVRASRGASFQRTTALRSWDSVLGCQVGARPVLRPPGDRGPPPGVTGPELYRWHILRPATVRPRRNTGVVCAVPPRASPVVHSPNNRARSNLERVTSQPSRPSPAGLGHRSTQAAEWSRVPRCQWSSSGLLMVGRST